MSLVNAYIIWSFINLRNSSKYLDRSKFYYNLVEGMLETSIFDERATTRTGRKKRKAQKNALSTPLNMESIEVEGHIIREFQPASHSHRLRPFRDENGHKVMYGTDGPRRNARTCVVCRKYSAQKRQSTKYYCVACQTPVCSPLTLREDVNGEKHLCWNILHQDVAMRRKVLKRLKRDSVQSPTTRSICFTEIAI